MKLQEIMVGDVIQISPVDSIDRPTYASASRRLSSEVLKPCDSKTESTLHICWLED
jgi:hypothetical protein